MPELPEVETMVRGICPSLVGRTITDFRRTRCPRKPITITPAPTNIARQIRGQTVIDVYRFGKRVLLEFDDGGRMAIEPRMTGLVLLADAPTRTHLRAVWQLAGPPVGGHEFLWFWDRRGLGTIRYYRPGKFEQEVVKRYGPDALAMSPAKWRTALATRRRPIKSALLDQAIVAGIGNLYASEILFTARIHPATPANDLSRRQINKLSAAVPQILNEAIKNEGSTLSDGTYRNVLNQNGCYQQSHQVYARNDEPCRRCHTPIVRLVQSGRSSFFCPRCQPEH